MEGFELNQIINMKKNIAEYTVSNAILKIFFFILYFIEIILNILNNELINTFNSLLKLNFVILQVLAIYLLLKNKYKINKEFILFLGLSYFTLLKIDETYFYVIFFFYLGYILINLKIRIIKKILAFLFLVFLLKLSIEKKIWILGSYYLISEKKLLLPIIILIIGLFSRISKFKKLNIKIYIFIICGILLEILLKNKVFLSNIYEICVGSLIVCTILISIGLFDFFIKVCCRYSILNKN
ncbi:hypothetical protein [Cetobacterium sp. 2G large]|uniref:hypothetical protein n=1 Tax=Cetobacterium sp. 2G large TaxID=2759680 RepID=UPI00163CB2ED|nr:hypothetical protein [Cetobacterium sp. 2G large]MBC2854548.1 hypothetical protein [Cetobacterium sp. 2G large]